MEYQVEIYETSSRIVTIDTENVQDALDKVQEDYADGIHVLDANDFQGVEFNIL